MYTVIVHIIVAQYPIDSSIILIFNMSVGKDMTLIKFLLMIHT